MSLPTMEQQMVDVLAKSIATYFQHFNCGHAESPRLSPEMIQSLLKEIRRRRGEHSDPAISDTEFLHRAQEKATQIFHEKRLHLRVDSVTTGSNLAQSFSLFESSGESALDNFLTFELIQERARDSHDILKILFKVKFIDDLIPDWGDITTFLHAELAVWLSSTEAPDFVAPLGFDFISLHWQWFDMTRQGIHSSQDYRMVQISLVQSLIDAIQTVENLKPDSRNRHFDFYKRCLRTILDMFRDWMDRNIGGGSSGHDPAIREIGMTLWDWSTTTPINADDRSSLLRRHCPHGQWIYQWFTQFFTVEELVSLLERSMTEPNKTDQDGKSLSVLYRLVHEASEWVNVVKKVDEGRVSSIGIGMSVFPRERESIDANATWNMVWVLSVVRSILCVSRVSHFPWHLLENLTPSGSRESFITDPRELQMQLWDMFSQLLHVIHQGEHPAMESSMDTNAVGVICTDSMEALLLGVPSCTQSIMLSNMVDDGRLEWVHRFRQRNLDV